MSVSARTAIRDHGAPWVFRDVSAADWQLAVPSPDAGAALVPVLPFGAELDPSAIRQHAHGLVGTQIVRIVDAVVVFVAGGAAGVVTLNIADFLPVARDRFGLEILRPGEFLPRLPPSARTQ